MNTELTLDPQFNPQDAIKKAKSATAKSLGTKAS
jgi:hypothetical protein